MLHEVVSVRVPPKGHTRRAAATARPSSSQDIAYYLRVFRDELKRDPTTVECFDLAQGNSEHSRHWFFGGKVVIDEEEMPLTLFQWVKRPLKERISNSVIGFHDNSSALRGYSHTNFMPSGSVAQPGAFQEVARDYDITLTVETHNFPCGIAPFPGAETGAGGRIRDGESTGKGSLVVAAVAGYATGNLHIPGYKMPWEFEDFKYPSNMAPPLQVLIDCSNGASDYGNKFGEPLICGWTRSCGMRMPSGERFEWVKPIMLSGGLGQMDHGHLVKEEPQAGQLVVKIGGPAYRIGVGGGAASSMVAGDNQEELDFNAVQRGDAEMQQKVNRVVRACVELGPKNPILSIHDQGAGGSGNVLKEISEPAGAVIDLRKMHVGDPSMSFLELWTAEFQENNALLLGKESEALFDQICKREKVPYAVVGTITGDGKVVVKDSRDNSCPVDLPLDKVLGKMPQKVFKMQRIYKQLPKALDLPASLTVQVALETGVLRLLSVCSKRFLTNKVDRSVTGQIAQQQCVGPLQTPLADFACIAQSPLSTSGGATAIGEQPLKGLAGDPESCVSMARLAVAEALTNLAWIRIPTLDSIKASGNWMWAAKLPGEGPKMYDIAEALSHIMVDLGIAIDGGKDSLSMAARVPLGNGQVETAKSPGQFVLTVYAPVPDVRIKATPDLKTAGEGALLFVDLGAGPHPTQSGRFVDDLPDLPEATRFWGDSSGFFHRVFTLVRKADYLTCTLAYDCANFLAFALGILLEEELMAAGGGEAEKGAWYQVPTWDGSPLTWRSFRREMRWWVSSLDLAGTARYNLAARWLLRQTGIVRQRGEEFDPSELAYKPAESYEDPTSGETIEVTPADYLFGLNKLLSALESINGQSALDKRGELRAQFYTDLKRAPGERLSEFATRFRTLAADLKAEGVVIQEAELGWFFKDKLGLDPLRKQLLDTALQGREDYNVIEGETAQEADDWEVPPEEVLATVAEEEDGGEEQNLEAFIQSEAEVLATELHEAEESGVNPEALEELESSFEQAAEALVTMREAKTKLQELRKDRGFGKPGSQGGGRSNTGVPAARKASGKHPCFDCGMHGHWAGDKECSRPGAGIGRKGAGKSGGGKVRPVRIAEVLQADHVLAEDKHLVGALDSACNRTCSGPRWLEGYLKQVREGPTWIHSLVSHVEEAERFKFGNGGLAPSSKRWRLPMCIEGRVLLVWVSEVPVASLGLLLGRDFLDAVGAILDFSKRTLQCVNLFADSGRTLELRQMAAGHFMLELLPDSWPRLGPGRWRRIGLDGIVELQLTPRSWLDRKIAEGSICFGEITHEHLLLEGSVIDFVQNLVIKDFRMAQLTFAQRMENQELQPLDPLTPQLLRTFQEVNTKAIVPYRWNRFILRVLDRRQWHARSLLIQFNSRSHLRYLPFPYPSVISVEQWVLQAQSMVNMGAMSRRHHALALEMGRFTATNLIELGRLRDRCGWKMAFVEDPLLAGFLAARSQKGQLARLKAAALEEAKAKVAKETAEMDREILARQLLGPRGGLPTLRADLVRLALLLNLTPSPKETVPQLQARIRPLVEILKSKPAVKQSDVGQKIPADPPRLSTPSSWSAVSSMSPPRAPELRQQDGCPFPQELHQMELRVQQMMEAQDSRFQDMLKQVLKTVAEGPHLSAEVVKDDFKISGKVKPGIRQMISQAWDQHRRDQLAISVGAAEVNEIFLASWDYEMKNAMNETFALEVQLPSPFVTEIYTDTEPVAKAARRQGLLAGDSLTLSSGWDFRLEHHRKKGILKVKETKPYLVILAFPCGPWSQLQALNPAHDLQRMREEALILAQFAIEVAQLQLRGKRHYLMENPRGSLAWKLEVLQTFMLETDALTVTVDMCRFGLRALDGELHRKATQLVTSMQALVSAFLDKRCTGDHPHTPVMGGSKVSSAAGHYTPEFAESVVQAALKQHDFETSMLVRADLSSFDVLEVEHEVLVTGEPGREDDEVSDASFEFSKEDDALVIPTAVKNAVYRLHVNTSHRSNHRLARALLIAGAPREAVLAAKRLKCAVCAERKLPRARPPASLPPPRDVGQQVHIDLVMLEDSLRNPYVVAHATDNVSRFQAAQVLGDKSTNSVIRFLTVHWLPLLGRPSTIVADQGREFVSAEFGDWCDAQSIYLYHIGVGAPWQNGICERSGATLKALVGATVQSHAISNFEEMEIALSEAVSAYNADVNEAAIDEVIQAAKKEAPELIADDVHEHDEPPVDQPDDPLQRALQPSEIVAALQPPASVVPSLIGRSSPPSLSMDAQHVDDAPSSAAPGTPVPSLILQASQAGTTSPAGASLSRTLERARALDEQSMEAERGVTRQLEESSPAAGTKRQADENAALLTQHVALPAFEALVLTHGELQSLSERMDVHPLLRLQAQADLDRREGNVLSEPEHGTWDGRWAFLCERDWHLLRELGLQLPNGAASHDALSVQASRKEKIWSKMTPEEQKLWGDAAMSGWNVYVDNQADDPLLPHLTHLSEKRGWHAMNGLGIQVAFNARSYRTPEPRFSPEELPLRSTFGRFSKDGQSFWHRLEGAVEFTKLSNQHQLIDMTVPILITLFHPRSSLSFLPTLEQEKKKDECQ
ncbi:unnamed protein product [Durusdinium trenchii]|uniref:Integrase catalytic domain-containing protein n=1 Tax=Durusdinium trenchii TaxID=1381693 RepID=A0ABP0SEZ7_9DINO